MKRGIIDLSAREPDVSLGLRLNFGVNLVVNVTQILFLERDLEVVYLEAAYLGCVGSMIVVVACFMLALCLDVG